MDENRQGATEGACKHIVINEDSGVSSRDSHEAAPSIDKEITEEIRPLVVAEMKRYGEKLRRIRQHYESKLKKFEDMQVEWIAMRDQEEIAVRVSREQEREIAELRQQLASAKEEVRKTKRLVSELVEKAAKGEAAILGLLKRTTAKDEELSLLERKVESLKSIIRGKQREGVDGKGCDSGTHGISKEKTKAVVSEEEFFKKSRQMACDLDAIYNEVQMAISGTVPDNECSLRSTLETELARLRERSARWKWESELLQKKQAEVKEKIDEMVPITKKILDSLTAFENFLQRPLCSNSNTAENSFIANSELCDENKAHLSEPSDERVLRKSEVRPSALFFEVDCFNIKRQSERCTTDTCV
uniref:Uncharacterized protein n=1 Tax=Parascaris univalens TaxID=6257 RepID=A0A915C2U0_PARUN